MKPPLRAVRTLEVAPCPRCGFPLRRPDLNRGRVPRHRCTSGKVETFPVTRTVTADPSERSDVHPGWEAQKGHR